MVTEKDLSRRLLMQMGISTAAASALASVTGGTLAHASNRSPARVDSGRAFFDWAFRPSVRESGRDFRAGKATDTARRCGSAACRQRG